MEIAGEKGVMAQWGFRIDSEGRAMKLRIGISSCLLGKAVRYDGGHKLDHYLHDILGKYMEWVPVCPESECGLGIPREAMRLLGTAQVNRLVTVKTGIDHTDRMLRWTEKKLRELEAEKLCGFIFKTRSPSSGLHDVKVYNDKGGMVTKRAAGIFAREFVKVFPLMPVEDEGRLHDGDIRENFIEQVFTFARWKEYAESDRSARGLVRFHTQHKLLYMAHDPALVSLLGKIVADIKGKPSKDQVTSYEKTMMSGLRTPATVKKKVNVLQHVMGYFKKQLSAEEKQELMGIITDFHKGFVPLIVPLVLLQHYIRKYDQPYLKDQVWLYPHPSELQLRNHV